MFQEEEKGGGGGGGKSFKNFSLNFLGNSSFYSTRRVVYEKILIVSYH